MDRFLHVIARLECLTPLIAPVIVAGIAIPAAVYGHFGLWVYLGWFIFGASIVCSVLSFVMRCSNHRRERTLIDQAYAEGQYASALNITAQVRQYQQYRSAAD